MTASRRTLAAAVTSRLAEIEHIQVYLREIDMPPSTVSATDLRVRPYVVVYPSPGIPVDQRFSGDRATLSWTVQVTCVAGDDEALDVLVDAVAAKLERWRPPVDDARQIGRLRSQFDPGPSRRDDDVAPSRFYVPLLYGLPV